MLTYEVRQYNGDTDPEAIVNLLAACETVDQLGNRASVEAVRRDYSDPQLDQARDIRLWENQDGRLLAFATVLLREAEGVLDGLLRFQVHPDARYGDLQEEIMAWFAERVREASTERGLRGQLRCRARTDEIARQALLQQHGFRISRYFLRMERSLIEPIPEPALPPGFALRTLKGLDEAEAWVTCFNDAFADHWNHHPLTLEQVTHHMSDATYSLRHDLIAVTEDGTFAAFCYWDDEPDKNNGPGASVGWIHLLGTRPEFRKLGLGRAMLFAGLRRLRDAGATSALLGVDAASPTGATRLYEAAGFKPVHTYIQYFKEL